MSALSNRSRLIIAGLVLLAFILVTAYLQSEIHFDTSIAIASCFVGTFIAGYIFYEGNE
ncbi:MAG: hypothetical protein IMW89_20820 [Ktedonobacteraceae bacterium]|nr:hypothetical protein [Ktedonobacteraceae bacterium]